MSDSSEPPWSGNPNAPQIPFWLYTAEKESFAGFLLGSVSSGIVIALFFQCLGVLLSPVNPISRGTKWALVTHTVAMFTFSMIPVGIYLYGYFVSYIIGREFPGNDDYPPGPFGYGYLLYTNAVSTIYAVMFPLNQWLADGLLLHRCYVIYSMNFWVVSFPCLMYLASIGIGIVYIKNGSTTGLDTATTVNVATSYFSICLSLNIILTLMIVTRLIMHRRNVRKVMGASGGAIGLYTAVVTMLIESYALYAIAFLLYMVPWAIESWVLSIFSSVLGAVQVMAPYLIILRVANRRALTSEMVTSGLGNIGSIHFRSQAESTDEDGSFPSGSLMNSTESKDEAPDEPGVGINAIEEVPL